MAHALDREIATLSLNPAPSSIDVTDLLPSTLTEAPTTAGRAPQKLKDLEGLSTPEASEELRLSREETQRPFGLGATDGGPIQLVASLVGAGGRFRPRGRSEAGVAGDDDNGGKGDWNDSEASEPNSSSFSSSANTNGSVDKEANLGLAFDTTAGTDTNSEVDVDVEKAQMRKSAGKSIRNMMTFSSNPVSNPVSKSAKEKKVYDPAFEVKFTSDADPLSPRSLPTWRKWLIVMVVSSTTFCVASVSSAYIGIFEQISEQWGDTRVVTTLGFTTFVIGLGLAPLILAPLTEFYGRRPIYVIATAFFAIWIIPCALAHNITTMTVARFLDGLAGAAFMSVAGSTIGDIFSKSEIQAPMMIYSASPFLGPELAPIISNFICYYLEWRWTFYVMLMWAGVQWALVVLFVPETYHPALLRREAQRLRRETGDDRYYAPIEKLERSIPMTILVSCYRPFMLLTLEPMVLLLCTLCAILLGLVYLFFEAFTLIFVNNHGFNLWQTGLTFLGIFVGMILAILSDGLWYKNYRRLLREHEQRTGAPGSEPEYRLPPATVGAPLIVIGLLWFGWTQFSSIHWIVPIIGSSFFGAGIILVFSGVFTFLVDSYPTYAASALAANAFLRSMFAAFFPLFGPTMYENLGYQWATFVLAMICLIFAPFPYIFYRYGKQIRSHSRYAGIR